MFIEVTQKRKDGSFAKALVNTEYVSTVLDATKLDNDCGVLLQHGVGGDVVHYQDSYDSIRTLLNAKWVAE